MYTFLSLGTNNSIVVSLTNTLVIYFLFRRTYSRQFLVKHISLILIKNQVLTAFIHHQAYNCKEIKKENYKTLMGLFWQLENKISIFASPCNILDTRSIRIKVIQELKAKYATDKSCVLINERKNVDRPKVTRFVSKLDKIALLRRGYTWIAVKFGSNVKRELLGLLNRLETLPDSWPPKKEPLLGTGLFGVHLLISNFKFTCTSALNHVYFST